MIDFIVKFTFGLLDCDCCIGDIVIPWIVKSGLCSIHFTVTSAWLKNVNRYIGNIVVSKIVQQSGFHCITTLTLFRPGGGDSAHGDFGRYYLFFFFNIKAND